MIWFILLMVIAGACLHQAWPYIVTKRISDNELIAEARLRAKETEHTWDTTDQN